MYNDLPKVTSVADGLEPRQSGSRVFTPTLHCLRKLDFPGNADQGHRSDHRKQEDPEEVPDRAPIELILQPPYFREGN